MSTLRSIPGVINVSCMNGSILDPEEALHSGFSWEGQAPDGRQSLFPSPRISHEFIETIDIEIKEGRTFSGKYAKEEEESKIIVNEAAVKMMGFRDPVGKTIYYGSEQVRRKNRSLVWLRIFILDRFMIRWGRYFLCMVRAKRMWW